MRSPLRSASCRRPRRRPNPPAENIDAAGLSSDVIILSFAIVVIGGWAAVEGAAVGAILVGLWRRAASVHLMPQANIFHDLFDQ